MPRQPKLVLIIIQFSNWWPHSQTIAHSGAAVTVVSQIILVATLFQEIPSLLSHLCIHSYLYFPRIHVSESTVSATFHLYHRASVWIKRCRCCHSQGVEIRHRTLLGAPASQFSLRSCIWKVVWFSFFKQQFVGSKNFHGQGAIVVTGHYWRFEFSLKSWIDDFTISKCGHSWGFLLSFTIEAQKSEVLHKGNRKLCKKHFSCFRVCVGSAAWPPAVKGSVSGVGFAWQVSPKGDSWLSFTTFLTNSATPFIWTPSGGAGASLKERRRPKGKT